MEEKQERGRREATGSRASWGRKERGRTEDTQEPRKGAAGGAGEEGGFGRHAEA